MGSISKLSNVSKVLSKMSKVGWCYTSNRTEIRVS